MKDSRWLKEVQAYYVEIYGGICNKGYGLHDKEITIDQFIILNQKWERAYNRKYNKSED